MIPIGNCNPNLLLSRTRFNDLLCICGSMPFSFFSRVKFFDFCVPLVIPGGRDIKTKKNIKGLFYNVAPLAGLVAYAYLYVGNAVMPADAALPAAVQ